MASAPEESVEKLKAFNAALVQAMSSMTRGTVGLQTQVTELGNLQSAAELLTDERPSSLKTVLDDLDAILDDDVDTWTTAAAEVKTVAGDQETTELAEANGRSDAEAAAFESMADDAVAGVHDSSIQLRLGVVALSDQAVYARAALEKLKAAATTAFAEVRTAAAQVVSDVAEEMKEAADDLHECASSLDAPMQGLEAALDGFRQPIGAAVKRLEQTHKGVTADLAKSYEMWKTDLVEQTARSISGSLAALLGEHGALLRTYAEGLGTNDADATLQQSLDAVQAEVAAWADRVADRAAFLSLLPGTAVALTEAQAIADQAAGVLGVL